jgi:hypothetical protein
MKSLAEAVVESAAFLELSGDDVVSPDSAVQALDSIASTMSEASDEEKKAVLDYCRQKATALAEVTSESAKRRRDFYIGFGENFGLIEE